MKSGQSSLLGLVGRFAKALVLWFMLASGIVLATHQARAFSSLCKNSVQVFLR